MDLAELEVKSHSKISATSPKVSWSWLRTSNRLHNLVGEYEHGETPVRARQESLALGLLENILIHPLENSSNTGVFIFSPTWSIVWEKHPMSSGLL